MYLLELESVQLCPLGPSILMGTGGWSTNQLVTLGYTISAYGPGDCDDTLPEVYPGAVEILTIIEMTIVTELLTKGIRSTNSSPVAWT